MGGAFPPPAGAGSKPCPLSSESSGISTVWSRFVGSFWPVAADIILASEGVLSFECGVFSPPVDASAPVTLDAPVMVITSPAVVVMVDEWKGVFGYVIGRFGACLFVGVFVPIVCSSFGWLTTS